MNKDLSFNTPLLPILYLRFFSFFLKIISSESIQEQNKKQRNSAKLDEHLRALDLIRASGPGSEETHSKVPEKIVHIKGCKGKKGPAWLINHRNHASIT